MFQFQSHLIGIDRISSPTFLYSSSSPIFTISQQLSSNFWQIEQWLSSI